MATGSSLSDSVIPRVLPTSYVWGSFTDIGREGKYAGKKNLRELPQVAMHSCQPLLGFSSRGETNTVSKTFLKAIVYLEVILIRSLDNCTIKLYFYQCDFMKKAHKSHVEYSYMYSIFHTVTFVSTCSCYIRFSYLCTKNILVYFELQ